jgi:hypothetical protein
MDTDFWTKGNEGNEDLYANCTNSLSADFGECGLRSGDGTTGRRKAESRKQIAEIQKPGKGAKGTKIIG